MRTGTRSVLIKGLSVDTVYIQTVWVHPKHRGKGKARELLTKFLEKHKARRIILEAQAFDPTGADTEALVQFYQSLGFQRLWGSPVNYMVKVPE